jgi:hypothetical protein
VRWVTSNSCCPKVQTYRVRKVNDNSETEILRGELRVELVGDSDLLLGRDSKIILEDRELTERNEVGLIRYK